MMREILSQRGFSQEEISTLESRGDYAEIRERVERMQADRLLDELETRTQARVEAAEGDLDARWEAFKIDINAIEIPEVEAPEVTETLEEMRTRLETEAQETLENSITERVGNIPLIGGAIAEWLTAQARELVSNTQEDASFGGNIKRWFITFIAGIFGMNSAFEQFEGAISGARNATLPEVAVPQVPEVPEVEISQEDSELLMYTGGVDLILMLSEDDNTTTRTLFGDRRVKESTFSDIISENFRIEETPQENVIALQDTIRSQESLIDSILGEENSDWRNLTLLQIFEEIGVYGQSLASLENLNPEDILSGDFSIGNLTLGEGGAIGGTLGSLFERYHNSENSVFHRVNRGLFGILITENSKRITDEDVEGLFANNTFETEEDNAFEQAFVEFGRGFIDVMANDFYLGPDEHREEFENFIREKSLTYREVLEFMILTGGSLEASSYNDAAKTIIYAKIWGFLGEEDSLTHQLRIKTYDVVFADLIQNGVSEGFENIPPQVRVVGNRLLQNTWDVLRDGAKEAAALSFETLYSIWNEMTLPQRVGLGAGGVVLLYIMIQSRYLRGFTAGSISIGSVAIVGALVFMAQNAWASEAYRNNNNQFNSEEELINAAIAEVTNAGLDLGDGVARLRSGDLGFDIDHTQIAAVGPIESGETSVLNDVPAETQTTYRSFLFQPQLLENDGMEIITAQGDIYSQSLGDLNIQKDRRTLAVTFLINGEAYNTYFRSEGGYWDGVSDEVLENSVFVRDNAGKVYLAVYRAGGFSSDTYVYISLEDLERQIRESNGEEILVAEDLYMSFDLMMNNS